MRKEELFEVIGELDGEIVAGARKPVKKMSWMVWGGAIAACLAAVVVALAFFPRPTAPEPVEPGYESETAIELVSAELRIYYLSESGTIESTVKELQCVPEKIFNEWAALNGIPDVAFVSCVYDSGGTETQHGDVVEYTVGDHFTLELTVSAEFSAYAESEKGELLIESLRRTFCDYIRVDDFNLIIADRFAT